MNYSEKILNQAKNYTSLNWKKTYRGYSVIILIISSSLVILNSLFTGNIISIAVAMVGQAITFIPVAWFIYKGKRWASVIAMILWTFSALKEISSYIVLVNFMPSNNLLLFVLFIYIFAMIIFVRTYKVETVRKNLKKESSDTPNS